MILDQLIPIPNRRSKPERPRRRNIKSLLPPRIQVPPNRASLGYSSTMFIA